MTNCPKCGKEVDPQKNYKITVRPDKKAESADITFGMCEDCALILILGLHKSQ
jgi:RNase P subunit RPR2